MKEYLDHCHQLAERDSALATEVRELRGLAGVMAWMARRGLALRQAEIVQQDEFSLDFLVPLLPGDRFLVFGIT